MENAFEMFDNLQTLRKQAWQELLAQAYLQVKLRRLPREKLRRAMEEEISFVNSHMHERIKIKLRGVASHLFRKNLPPLLRKFTRSSPRSSTISYTKSTATSERKSRGRSPNYPS
jgi:hypothetical protein